MQKIIFLCAFVSFFQTAFSQGYTQYYDHFILLSTDHQDTLFSAKQVSVDFNEDTTSAIIRASQSYQLIFHYPYNRFHSDHTDALWKITEGKVMLASDTEQGRFFSADPDMDELEMQASDGFLDLKTKQLHVNGIPYIRVANTLVIPEDNHILINQNLPNLQNATVILNSFTRYFKLAECELKILSRAKMDFIKGKLVYLFEKNKSLLPIQTYHNAPIFRKYSMAYETDLIAVVDQKSPIQIHEKYLFHGLIYIKDSDENPFFDGMIAPLPKHKNWTHFKGSLSSLK